MAKARDYKAEYAATQGTEKGKKDRAARNRARREMMKAGRVKKGDGKHVHHKDYNPRNGSPSNLAVISRKSNQTKQPKRS